MFLDPRLRTEHRTVCRHLHGAVLSPIERSAGVIKHLTPRRVVKRVLGSDGSPQPGAVSAKRPRRRVGNLCNGEPRLWFGCSIFLCCGWRSSCFPPLISLTASIYWVVTSLAVDDRARAFKALSPALLSPLGILFALLVGFIAVEVWSNFDKAKAAVATEASALRAVVVLAGTFPEEQKTHIYALVDRHIEVAVNEVWPAMAHHRATLSNLPTALTETLYYTLSLEPAHASQRITQSEMV